MQIIVTRTRANDAATLIRVKQQSVKGDEVNGDNGDPVFIETEGTIPFATRGKQLSPHPARTKWKYSNIGAESSRRVGNGRRNF